LILKNGILVLAARTIAIAALVAIASHANAQSVVLKASPARSITYEYELITDNSPELCGHMKDVFNAKFQNIWDVKDALGYEALTVDSEYVFPRSEGVAFDVSFASEMLYSKWPSSTEFGAIRWMETRVIIGAPPGVTISASNNPLPALIAYADIDNDGKDDTLLRYGFNPGYRNMLRGMLGGEYLAVWRSQRMEIAPNASIWSLLEGSKNRPSTMSGAYLRPFIFEGRAYMTDYEMQGRNLGTPSARAMPTAEFMWITELQLEVEGPEVGRSPAIRASVMCK
jgi:hypothetical protein